MALTLRGNRTGQAASNELKEQASRRLEDAIHEGMKRAAMIKKITATMDALAAADPNWLAWYDSDAVPDWHDPLDAGPALKIIRAHIAHIRSIQNKE